MLILIYGVTGVCGQAMARAALNAGHQVRGLARTPEKLVSDIASKLERFVKMKDLYDIPALQEAVEGVDAIISAANYTAGPVVEGQILLLRAAERAGVKIFHAASWNYDWTRINLGQCEMYDSYIAFRNHARLSSPIKPIYGFTGAIVEYTFCYFPAANPINKEARTYSHYGTGDEFENWTVLENVASYAVQAVSEPNAAEGKEYHVESFKSTPRQLAQVYEEVRGIKLELISRGTAEDADKLLETARASTPAYRFLEYGYLSYLGLALRGVFLHDSVDSTHWGHIKQVGFKEWLQKNSDV